MVAGYVTNYGNVENDGLSWDTPKRSIQSAKDAGLYPQFIKGLFNESLSLPDQVFDGNNHALLIGYPDLVLLGGQLTNMEIRNYVSVRWSHGYTGGLRNSKLINVTNLIHISHESIWHIRSLIANVKNQTIMYSYLRDNMTIYNCDIVFSYTSESPSGFDKYALFSECKLKHTKLTEFRYTLFHNCTFMFSGGGLGTDETVYIAPTGATDTEKLENIRNRMATVYGGSSSDYLKGCKYQTDGDLFINPAKENFYLVPECLASKMSYEGSFVGKYPEGSLADFATDFASYTNIDANGDIIDQTVNATAETNINDLGKLRHISSLKALGERAIRNGNEVNLNANLGASVYPGTSLTDGATYIVRTEAISLTASGITRDVGETFIATAADGLDFTSDTGYVQQYIFDQNRTIEMKVSKTDAALSTAVWIKLKLDEMPMVNYDANGVVQYGNADDNYDSGTAERMFIRYWKAKITVQAKNLPG